MEHHITGKNVCVCLGSSLCIHAVEYVAEIMEYVKTIDHKGQLAFERCVSNLSIPYKIRFVQCLVGIAIS